MNRATFTSTLALARPAARLTLALLLAVGFFWAVHPAAAQDGGQTHTVQAGENLYRIALQYGLSVDQLVTANAISDPTRIYSGQVLAIPLNSGADAPTADRDEPALHNSAVNPAPDMSTYHTIQTGETLTSIAAQYGMSWQDLMAANGLGDASHVLVGQSILIPDVASGSSNTAAPPPATDAEPAAAQTGAEQSGGALTDTAQTSDAPTTDAPDAAQQRTDDLGIVPSDTELIYDVPDQVDAMRPATETRTDDLGILSVPAQQADPVPAANVAPAANTTAANTAPAAGERSHTVQGGEHLASIAAQYGLSYPTLAMANNITNPNQIYAGQTLVIPAQDYAPGSYVPQSTVAPAAAEPTVSTGKQIVVDLSDQRVYAYENGQLLRNMLVSTGTAAFPTVQGDYKVYLKYESQTMSGPGYNLPGVPYVLYFYKGYSLHGTYWHSNFGTPMSHGCVNMHTPDAQWVWNWAPLGTPVHVQW